MKAIMLLNFVNWYRRRDDKKLISQGWAEIQTQPADISD